jgi:superfamily I DNA/RNA helicase
LAGIAAPRYWRQEIDFVIKGRGLRHFVEYEALPRRGRSISLTPDERKPVWRLLTAYDEELERRGVHDFNDLLSAAVNLVARGGARSPWTAVVVDEVQDLPLIGVRLCALLGGTGPDGLFLVGDGQQAIYPGGFTLSEAGVSVVGRAAVLQVNYRNTRQILDFARVQIDGDDFSDLDGTDEHGTRDVEVIREGATPTSVTAPDRWRLALLLAMAVRRDATNGVDRGEMAVLTMSRGDAAFLRDQLASRGIRGLRDLGWTPRPPRQDRHRSAGKRTRLHRRLHTNPVAKCHARDRGARDPTPAATVRRPNPSPRPTLGRRGPDLFGVNCRQGGC